MYDNNGDKIEGLREILGLIQDNSTSGWKGEELQGSLDCVALQDVRHTHEDDADFIEYNGWYEKLEKLA